MKKKFYHHKGSKGGTPPGIIEGYKELACSIVLQAVDDYRGADEQLPRKKAERARQEIRLFILSPYFGVLCDLDPVVTLSELDKQIKGAA